MTLAGLPHRELVGVYYDDPAVTPPDQLPSDAGVLVEDGVPLPPPLDEYMVDVYGQSRAEWKARTR